METSILEVWPFSLFNTLIPHPPSLLIWCYSYLHRDWFARVGFSWVLKLDFWSVNHSSSRTYLFWLWLHTRAALNAHSECNSNFSGEYQQTIGYFGTIWNLIDLYKSVFQNFFFQRRSKSWSLIDASRLGIELKFDRITLDYLCALSFWRCRVLGNISTRWSRDCAMRRNSAGDLSEEGIAFRLFRLFRLFRHLSNHTSSPSRATEASKFNRCSNNKTKSFIDCNNPMLHQRISSLFNYPIFTTNSKFKFVSIMGRDFNEIM